MEEFHRSTQSPDLNPVRHIWDGLECPLWVSLCCQTLVADLTNALVAQHEQIPAARFQHLVERSPQPEEQRQLQANRWMALVVFKDEHDWKKWKLSNLQYRCSKWKELLRTSSTATAHAEWVQLLQETRALSLCSSVWRYCLSSFPFQHLNCSILHSGEKKNQTCHTKFQVSACRIRKTLQ